MGDGVNDKCNDFFSVESQHIKYPSTYAVSLKNFRNAVLENYEKNGAGCAVDRESNITKSHVRNRKLLDLSFKKAKCCTKIYNAMIDRQKLKKLQKYNLSRPVRVITTDLEPEEVKKCDFAAESDSEEAPPHFSCGYHETTDDESDEASDDVWLKACSSGSLSECSGCSTIGPVKKQKFHEVPRLHWQDLLHGSQVEYCKNIVVEVLTKYKGRPNAILKLKKYYLK